MQSSVRKLHDICITTFGEENILKLRAALSMPESRVPTAAAVQINIRPIVHTSSMIDQSRIKHVHTLVDVEI